MLDAGLDPLSDHVGLGFIARNHMGEVLFSRWLCDQRLKLAEEAECLAAWTGLKYTPHGKGASGWNQTASQRYII
jgi:hypothetical protein